MYYLIVYFTVKKTERTRQTPSKKTKHSQDDIYGRGDSGDNGDGGNPDQEQEDLEDGQCPFCNIRPSIANSNNAATWLGNGQHHPQMQTHKSEKL